MSDDALEGLRRSWPLWLDQTEHLQAGRSGRGARQSQGCRHRLHRHPTIHDQVIHPKAIEQVLKNHHLSLLVFNVPRLTVSKCHIFKWTHSLLLLGWIFFWPLLISQVKENLQVWLRGKTLELIRANSVLISSARWARADEFSLSWRARLASLKWFQTFGK